MNHTIKCNWRRICLAVIIFVIITAYACPIYAQNLETSKNTIIVSGLKRSYSNQKKTQYISDTITVKAAGADTLELQIYDTSTKRWNTQKRFVLTGKYETENVTLTYPNDWKEKSRSQWRIYIPENELHDQYISQTITINAVNLSNLSFSSKAVAIIREDDATLLYGKNMNKRLPNASTTKMLTALLLLESGKSLNKTVTMSANAAATSYGILNASSGSKYKAKDLLSVMLISSSNDAAVALAEYVKGSVSKFATLQNKKAKKLGCKNTHFVNPNGLPAKKHYSSAYDLCLIQKACFKYDTYQKIIKKKSCTIKMLNKSKKKTTFYSTVELLGTSGFLGGKTGRTTAAGHCFSGVYRYKGENYIFTVLGSKSSKGRWNDCKKAMKYIRDHY